ncbi:hypothetical protein [Bacillus velezensis]|uniref:hypothetical protein n=1 Tax=Bacillus velezensis TaxID=492670 RepID=UPI0019D1F88D|nr:hypothetical protein [Bacillus velezensis]
MAKLDGVKTLDMVNGEITKVAYGGAEYVKTDSPVQEGDLFLLTAGHEIISGESGEFYLTEKYRNGNIVIPTRFLGNATATQSDGDGIAFRKVAAAANPSVEERVAKAEGEIEALKSDVAALKGEPEYKRIDRSEARAGDFVKFDDPPSYLTDKEYYEIKEFAQGDPVIIDDDGDEYDTYSDEFEVYRKVSAASVEAERLKVGDYAKVVNATDYHRFTDGDIVEIIGDRFGSPYNELARRLTDEKNQYVPKRELVRATDEEVAEAKDAAARAKFERGAKVRLLSGGGDYPLSGFENDKIYEVLYNNFNHPKGKRIRIADSTERFGYATPDQLEILTEEEAAKIERQQAEEAKWAKIGRKIGEYKEGDVVQFKDDYVAIGVVEDVGTSRLGVRMPDEAYQGPYKNDVTLITPVEARFDR